MKLYKDKDVRELFDKYSVLLGPKELVPVRIAKKLFGEDAVKACYDALKIYDGVVDGCDFYDLSEDGLTLFGMQIAASYLNVLELRKEEASKDED